jgi:hypothetical protein
MKLKMTSFRTLFIKIFGIFFISFFNILKKESILFKISFLISFIGCSFIFGLIFTYFIWYICTQIFFISQYMGLNFYDFFLFQFTPSFELIKNLGTITNNITFSNLILNKYWQFDSSKLYFSQNTINLILATSSEYINYIYRSPGNPSQSPGVGVNPIGILKIAIKGETIGDPYYWFVEPLYFEKQVLPLLEHQYYLKRSKLPELFPDLVRTGKLYLQQPYCQEFPYFTIFCDSQLAIERVQNRALQTHELAHDAALKNIPIWEYFRDLGVEQVFDFTPEKGKTNLRDRYFALQNDFPVYCGGRCTVLIRPQYGWIHECAVNSYPGALRIPRN